MQRDDNQHVAAGETKRDLTSMKRLFGGYLALYFLVLLSPASQLILSYPELAWKISGQAWLGFAPIEQQQILSLIGRALGLLPVGLLLEVSLARTGKISYVPAIIVGAVLGAFATCIQMLKLDGLGTAIEPIFSAVMVCAGVAISRWARPMEPRQRAKYLLLILLSAVPMLVWSLWHAYGLIAAVNLATAKPKLFELIPFYATYHGAEGGQLLPLPHAIALYLPVGVFWRAFGGGRLIGVRGGAIIAALLAILLELAKLITPSSVLQTENILLAALAGALGVWATDVLVRFWRDGLKERLDNASLGLQVLRPAQRAGQVVLGILFLAAGFAGAAAHNLAPTAFVLVLLVYAALLWWRPSLWLWSIPALLPVLALSPWTGRIYFDEFDSLMLVTLGVGYIRTLPLPVLWRFSLGNKALLFLLTASYLLSATTGLRPIPALDFNAFSDYASNFNSLRLLKGFLWALLLLPLLQRILDKEGQALERSFFPGVLTGLAAVSLVALWERFVFTGLMNFSMDYRITATFPEMHTGGAALDGYLALSVPFIFGWLFHRRGVLSTSLGLALAGIAGYAVMVTFSRGLYLGIALAASLMTVIWLLRNLSHSRNGVLAFANAVKMLLLLVCVVAISAYLFAQGGYRVLAAGLGLMTAALFVPFFGKSGQTITVGLVILLLAMASMGIGWALPSGEYLSLAKGPYLAYALSVMGFLLALALKVSKMGQAAFFARASLGWMAFNTLLVANHWGQVPALVAAGVCVFATGGALFLARVGYVPTFTPNRNTIVVAGIVAASIGLTIPILGNWYLGQRLSASTVNHDLETRYRHWQASAHLMGPGWTHQLFGLGVGRFAQAYSWGNTLGESPPRFSFQTEGEPKLVRWGSFEYRRIQDQENVYLKLISGRGVSGNSEPLRYGQRVNLVPGERYDLQVKSRTTSPQATLIMEVCDKWLLYPVNCNARLVAKIKKGNWQEFTLNFKAAAHDFMSATPTRQLIVYNDSPGTWADVDNVRLMDATGRDLIANGDFSQGGSRWFFSSDHYHLPWHAKNLWLHVWLEQGWLGMISCSLLLATAIGVAWVDWYRGESSKGVLAFALTSFAVVGLFDSLIDVPRITTLLFLLIWLVLLQAKKEHKRRSQKSK